LLGHSLVHFGEALEQPNRAAGLWTVADLLAKQALGAELDELLHAKGAK